VRVPHTAHAQPLVRSRTARKATTQRGPRCPLLTFSSPAFPPPAPARPCPLKPRYTSAGPRFDKFGNERDPEAIKRARLDAQRQALYESVRRAGGAGLRGEGGGGWAVSTGVCRGGAACRPLAPSPHPASTPLQSLLTDSRLRERRPGPGALRDELGLPLGDTALDRGRRRQAREQSKSVRGVEADAKRMVAAQVGREGRRGEGGRSDAEGRGPAGLRGTEEARL
jgi:hypothetical protein